MCVCGMREYHLRLVSSKGHTSCFIHFIYQHSLFFYVWSHTLMATSPGSSFLRVLNYSSSLQFNTQQGFKRGNKEVFLFYKSFGHRILFLLPCFMTLLSVVVHIVHVSIELQQWTLYKKLSSVVTCSPAVNLSCSRLSCCRKSGSSMPLPDCNLYGSWELWNNLLLFP